MKRLFKYLLIFMCISCYDTYAQEQMPVNKWMEYIEELAENAEESEEYIETLYNDLSYLSEHPLDLNKITAEQLSQFPFLSAEQIDDLITYQEKQGKFVSIYELKNIKSMDMQTIELFLPFVYVGEYRQTYRPFKLKDMLKYGDSELMLNYNQCLNKKQGYSNIPDSVIQKYPNRKYKGEPFYHSLRYSYSYDDRLQFGLVAEKDAGEAFWNNTHKGYDFYSAHAFMKNLGKITSLAVGDYKVSFGQGLVVSNDFSPSRSSILSQAERRNNGFRRHYSTNEKDFFRGIASTVSVNNINISAFYSYRKLDAATDSATISSFKKDGMHRTESEIAKKRTAEMQTFGGNVRYATSRFSIGLTALTYYFGDLSVEQEIKPYSKFYFRGKQNTNASIDYIWRNKRISFYGETAISKNGAAATLNALHFNASNSFKALVLYRYYDRRYQAFFGNAFSQGSTVQNEEGLYLSLQWAPIAFWRLSGYADFFRYPWIKYGIDAPSSGKEYMIQADFIGIKNTTVSARYKFRKKEKNYTAAQETTIESYDQHRIRLQLIYAPSNIISFKTTAERNIYDENVSPASRGWMISQSAGIANPDFPLQAYVFAAYFDTDDYNSRIYAYEKNMLYSFSMPSFYGEGIRIASVFRYNFTRKLSLSLKAALTHYYDRDSIGTGLETIEGRDRADIYVQMRCKF